MVAWWLRWGKGGREGLPKTIKKFVGMMDMFSTLIIEMVLWVYKCVKNSQIVQFKCVQFIVNYTSIKL